MAVFRVERTGDYTTMSNHHLKNQNLSLKAKGLLSQMLSLPDTWDYTLSGLCQINRDSKDSIRSAIRELEEAGYVERKQQVTAQGRFSSNEYIIYEHPVHPQTPSPAAPKKTTKRKKPSLACPSSDSPLSGNPTTEKPSTENPTQLNMNQSNTNQSSTNLSSTHSFSSHPDHPSEPVEAKEQKGMSIDQIESYRALIYDNIEYEHLQQDPNINQEELAEIVELIVETVTSVRKTTRIAGSNMPHEVVRSRFLKLNMEHILFVMDCLNNNTTQVRNIKQYLLTVLFNAFTTMSNQYRAQVNHDLYGSD